MPWLFKVDWASLFTPEEKAEREARIAGIDAEEKIKEARDAEKAAQRAAAARLRQQAAAAAAYAPRGIPVARGGPGAVRQLLDAMARRVVAPGSDEEDEEYDPAEEVDEDEDDELDFDDGFVVPEEDVEVHEVAPPRRARPRPTYSIDAATDRHTACRICCAIIEQGLIRLRQVNPAGPVVTRPQHFHLSCYTRDPQQPRLTLAQLNGYEALNDESKIVVQGLVLPPV